MPYAFLGWPNRNWTWRRLRKRRQALGWPATPYFTPTPCQEPCLPCLPMRQDNYPTSYHPWRTADARFLASPPRSHPIKDGMGIPPFRGRSHRTPPSKMGGNGMGIGTAITPWNAHPIHGRRRLWPNRDGFRAGVPIRHGWTRKGRAP